MLLSLLNSIAMNSSSWFNKMRCALLLSYHVLISVGAKPWQYFLLSPDISRILPDKDLFLLFLLHFNTMKDWDYQIWINSLKSRVKLSWNSSELYIYQPPLHSVCRSAYHILKAFTIRISRRSLIKMWSHDSYGSHGNSG